jgi:hypothetical protein
MVVMKEGVKLSSLKRRRQHDLPTPESPIRRSFIWKGLVGGGEEMMGRGRQVGAYQEVVIAGARHCV